MAKTKEIVPFDPKDVKDVAGLELFNLKDNIEGVKPKLPTIKIHHQAGLFELPDGRKVESFPAIIIDQFPTNAWWKESYGSTGGGTAPDCFSMNGRTSDPSGEDVQAEHCGPCPKNAFGTATKDDGSPARGKACKNMKRVHVLMDGSSYPHRITIPPTSLGVFDQYVATVTDMGMAYQLVYTEFLLKTTPNKDGVVYSELNMKVISAIKDMPTAQAIKTQMEQWAEAMRGEPILFED